MAAAAGIRQVIDSQMADLIRKTTLERGHDPRDFVMMAYGGAGPAHAASYGGEVGVREIIVPFFATVHSAYGAAQSDVRFSLEFSEPLVVPVAAERLERIFSEMESRGTRQLAEADVPQERWRFHAVEHSTAVKCIRQGPRARMPRRRGCRGGRCRVRDRIRASVRARAAPATRASSPVSYGVDGRHSWVPQGGEHAGTVTPRTRRMTWPRAGGMVTTPIYEGRPAGGRRARRTGHHRASGTTIVVLAARPRIDTYGHAHILMGMGGSADA